MAVKKLTELFSVRDDESHMIESETGYIYDKLIAAASEKMIGTELLALRLGPGDIPGSSTDVQLADKDTLGVHGPIAEGAEIPHAKMTFSELTYTPLKYGAFNLITEEMVEDNKFAVQDFHLKEIGYQIAQKYDTEILKAIETGADANSTDHNATCTGLTLAGITDAMEFIEADSYTPTDLIVQSSEVKDLRKLDVFVDASISGGPSAVNTNLIGSIYGNVKVWQSENVNTSGDALMLDRSAAVCLAEKRPITVKGYDPVLQDARGAVATCRMAAGYLRKEACCTITVS